MENIRRIKGLGYSFTFIDGDWLYFWTKEDKGFMERAIKNAMKEINYRKDSRLKRDCE